MLPVHKSCPAVVNGGIGGGGYVHGDIVAIGGGNERDGGEEKNEEEAGCHFKIKNETSESSWIGVV